MRHPARGRGSSTVATTWSPMTCAVWSTDVVIVHRSTWPTLQRLHHQSRDSRHRAGSPCPLEEPSRRTGSVPNDERVEPHRGTSDRGPATLEAYRVSRRRTTHCAQKVRPSTLLRCLGRPDSTSVNLSASATSGLASTSPGTPSVCTVTGSTVSLIATGLCSIAGQPAVISIPRPCHRVIQRDRTPHVRGGHALLRGLPSRAGSGFLRHHPSDWRDRLPVLPRGSLEESPRRRTLRAVGNPAHATTVRVRGINGAGYGPTSPYFAFTFVTRSRGSRNVIAGLAKNTKTSCPGMDGTFVPALTRIPTRPRRLRARPHLFPVSIRAMNYWRGGSRISSAAVSERECGRGREPKEISTRSSFRTSTGLVRSVPPDRRDRPGE